jgi:beta-lactamase regulating signal transducer with metallopeptidase domain
MLPPFVKAFLALAPFLLNWSTGLVAWLATYAIHSTLFIGAVWLATSGALGRRVPVARSVGLWRLALVAGVITTTLQVNGALASLTPPVELVGGAAPAAYRVLVTSRADVGMGVPLALTTRIDVHPLWPIVVMLLWIVGASCALGLLALARRRLTRVLAARSDGAHSVAGTALREVMRRAYVRREISLGVVDDLASPVALGRTEICLPRRALVEFDPAHLESILAHELAHLERNDALWLILARVIEALFFFQPLNRLARRRMIDAAEFAADEWAVAVTSRPVTLARCLARVAEWASSESLAMTPAMAERRSSTLVRRVRFLTSASEPASPGIARAAVLVAMVVLALVAPHAAIGSRLVAPGPGRQMQARFERELRAGPSHELRILTLDSNVVMFRR